MEQELQKNLPVQPRVQRNWEERQKNGAGSTDISQPLVRQEQGTDNEGEGAMHPLLG